MKNFTAIYSTDYLKNIHYSFKAKNLKEAKKFCNYKISVKKIKIIQE
jgi:hypothetical protein